MMNNKCSLAVALIALAGLAQAASGDLDGGYNFQIQQQPRSNLRNFGRQQQEQSDQVSNDANSVEVAALVGQQQQQQMRRRRSLNQVAQFPLRSEPTTNLQQLYDDERTIGRQLPELIAQAHRDKNVERALLKMLINASLRSALNNVPTAQVDSHYNSRPDVWQDSNEASMFSGLERGAIPRMSARLERVIDEYANIDPLASSISQGDIPLDQYQSVIDKREYIKPCSFNAVSCAKNPFRNLKTTTNS